jgi:hypothetical protein
VKDSESKAGSETLLDRISSDIYLVHQLALAREDMTEVDFTCIITNIPDTGYNAAKA